MAAAARLIPGGRPVSILAAEIALASGDPEQLERAFAQLRRWAPSAQQANVAENYFRTQHNLPLRPESAGDASGG